MDGLTNRLLALLCLLSVLSATLSAPLKTNHELLTHLGMSKRRNAGGHHRKRLASESRGSHNGEDSHMFVIKLPPNPHYYSHSKPEKVSDNSINKIPLSFRSNGKPARVYHWNIPVLQKMAHSRRSPVPFRVPMPDSKLYNVQVSPRRSDATENDVLSPLKPHHNTRQTSIKRKPSVSYYAPTSPKKNMFQKYFQGNGKPQSFYVIEKSRKPINYHRLLP